MWLHHLINLLFQSASAIPTSLGSTWLGMLFPLWVFVIAELVTVFVNGWQTTTIWLKNLGIGALITLIAWGALFFLCIIRTVYRGHMSLAGSNTSLRAQVAGITEDSKEKLAAIKSNGDQQLARLRQDCAYKAGLNDALQKQNRDQQGTINNCQTQALHLLAPEPMKIVALPLEPASGGVGIQHVKLIVLVNKTITPVRLVVTCQKSFISAAASIVGSGFYSGGTSRVTDTIYEVDFSAPAWGPESPLIFDMSYRGNRDNACSFVER